MIPDRPQKNEAPDISTIASIIIKEVQKPEQKCHECNKEMKHQETFVVTYKEDGKFIFKTCCEDCIPITNPVYIGTVETFLKRAKYLPGH